MGAVDKQCDVVGWVIHCSTQTGVEGATLC